MNNSANWIHELVAGPIVRYNTISHQLHTRTVDADKFSEGIRRFIN
ncbi:MULTISPECIES: hypothetical protein [unclassified Bacillus (in: firmicutes)]